MRAIRSSYLLSGAALGFLFPFLAVILAGRGLDPWGIGVTTALSAVAYTLAIPAWGHLGDVVLGRRRALSLAAFGSAGAMLVFGLPGPALVAAAAYVASSCFTSAVNPLSDALAVNALPEADRDRGYGRIRLLASLSYALVSIAAGVLFEVRGYGSAAYLAAAMFVGLGLVARWVPDIERAGLPERSRRGGSIRAAFDASPRLAAVLAAIGLASVGVLAGFTFLPLRLADIGGGPVALALAGGLAALAEIPGFAFAGRVATRFGLRGLFVGSVLLDAACFLAWAVVGLPGLIVASRVAEGLAFAGFTLASVVTIGLLLPPRLQATGQALFATVSMGIAAGIADLAGGALYGVAGSSGSVLFAATAGVAVVASVAGWHAFPGPDEVRTIAGPVTRDDAGSGDPRGDVSMDVSDPVRADPVVVGRYDDQHQVEVR